jgi:hypothetical protein
MTREALEQMRAQAELEAEGAVIFLNMDWSLRIRSQ